MARSAIQTVDLYPADPTLDIPTFVPRLADTGDVSVGSPVHTAQDDLALAFSAETDRPYGPLVKATLLVGVPLAFWTVVAVIVARAMKAG